MLVQLTRVQVPVGRGFFHTCRLSLKSHDLSGLNSRGWNLVYDCGSIKSSLSDSLAESYVKQIAGEDIDLLVLSHLHADHINSVPKLCSALRSEKRRVRRVVLPYISRLERLHIVVGLVEGVGSDPPSEQFVDVLRLAYDPVSWFRQLGDSAPDTIYLVRPDNDGPLSAINEPEIINWDPQPLDAPPPETSSQSSKSSEKVDVHPDAAYRRVTLSSKDAQTKPVLDIRFHCHACGISQVFLRQASPALAECGLLKALQSDSAFLFKKPSDRSTAESEHWSSLRQFYCEVGKKLKEPGNKGTALNATSLSMATRPSEHFIVPMYRTSLGLRAWCYAPGWLVTGDALCDQEPVMASLLAKLGGMGPFSYVALPHHGSNSGFNSGFHSKMNPLLTYATCKDDKEQHFPGSLAKHSSALSGVPIHLVTEEWNSGLSLRTLFEC